MSKKNLAGNISFDDLLQKADGMKQKIDGYRQGDKYKPDYIEQERQKFIQQLKQHRDSLYKGRLEGLRNKLDGVKADHLKGKEDSTQELLNLNRASNKIKACSKDELKQMFEQYYQNQQGSADEYNILCAELRNRGMNDDADSLRVAMKEFNAESPWENDPEYQQTMKEINNTEAEAVHDDMLMLEDGSYITVDEMV